MNFIKRSIVAIVFIPLLLWLYYTGGVWLRLFLTVLTVLSTYELQKMRLFSGKWKKEDSNSELINLFFSMALFVSISLDSLYLFHIIVITLLYNGILSVFTNKLEGAVGRISFSLFSVIYPAVGFGLIFNLSTLSLYQGTILPILAILIWVTDTFAYFTGRIIGKHKNIFSTSPNKSAEGFIAGLVFAFISAFAVTLLYPNLYSIKHAVFFTVAAGIFGQFGDLFESLIKRDMGVKDSSNLIPGHGGVLDRFDSVLIAGPILWCLVA